MGIFLDEAFRVLTLDDEVDHMHGEIYDQVKGFLRALFGNRYEVCSAGTDPNEVNPQAVKVMAEVGIDISDHQSNNVEDFLDQEWDYVVTVCDRANETCPFFPGGKEKIHRGFEDPAALKGREDERMDAFRLMRDEIKRWIEENF